MELRNKQLIIETTNLCDAHCIMCPREKFTQKSQIMDMGLFRKIIDDAVQYDLESLDCCGFGDCFLDKKLFERFDYVKQQIPDIDIFISTNAYHMNEDHWDNILKYVDTLKFSVYGVTSKTHEAVHRGKVKFQPTMNNILGYLDFAKNMPNKPYVIGLYLIMDINKHEQEPWIKCWQPRFDEVFVWLPHNWVGGRSYRGINSKQTSCGRPQNGPMYIHANGMVSPCCFDINKELIVGDLKNQTIEQIYKSKEYYRIKEAHYNKDFQGLICQNCDQTNYNPDVLVYKSNQSREVGQITSNQKKVI